MTNFKFYTFAVFASFALLSVQIQADQYNLTQIDMSEINSRVDSMDYDQLNERKNQLNAEKKILQNQEKNTQSPAQKKALSKRISEITAELSSIQKALLAVLGVAAVSALTNDD